MLTNNEASSTSETYNGTTEQMGQISNILIKDRSQIFEYLRANNIPANTSFRITVPQYNAADVTIKVSLLQLMIESNFDDGIKFLFEQDRTLIDATHEQIDPLSNKTSYNSTLGLFVYYPNMELLGFIVEQGASIDAHEDTLWGNVKTWQFFALEGNVSGLQCLLSNNQDIDLDTKIGEFTISQILEAKTHRVNTYLTTCYNKLQANHKKDLYASVKPAINLLKKLELPIPSIKFFPSLIDVLNYSVRAK